MHILQITHSAHKNASTAEIVVTVIVEGAVIREKSVCSFKFSTFSKVHLKCGWLNPKASSAGRAELHDHSETCSDRLVFDVKKSKKQKN